MLAAIDDVADMTARPLVIYGCRVSCRRPGRTLTQAGVGDGSESDGVLGPAGAGVSAKAAERGNETRAAMPSAMAEIPLVVMAISLPIRFAGGVAESGAPI